MRVTWQYVGGFFDGEGCVYLSHRERDDGTADAQVRVTMVQSDRTVLDAIRTFLVSENIHCSNLHVRHKVGTPGHLKGLWSLDVHRRADAQRFLHKIIGNVIVKKVVAQDALRYLTLFPSVRRFANYRQEVAARMAEVRKDSPAWIAACERRRKHNRADILAMRTNGIPVREIAARIGVTETRAYKLIRLARQQGG